jgi:ABC-type amino acid transport substrate-binding protein
MQGGRYDCIVGGITITPERERILAWSVPYFTTTLSLVVNGREDARDPEPYGSEARVGRRAGGDHRLRRGGLDAATGRTQHKSLSTRPDRAGDEGS